MKKKFFIMGLIFMVVIFCMGCGLEKKKVGEENVVKQEEEFPEKYCKKYDKVEFQCKVEMPKEWKSQKFHKAIVKGRQYVKQDQAIREYTKGKEIKETYTNSISGKDLKEKGFEFQDGSSFVVDVGVSYSSKYSSYYFNVGAADADHQMDFSKGKVDFSSSNECVKEIKTRMNQLGYHSDEFDFFSYPLNHQMMDEKEKSYIRQKLIDEKDRKGQWTKKDDAYMIYAYQKWEGLPVFHEYMSIAKQMAYDSPDAAPVQAIISARGLEDFRVNPVYSFIRSKEMVHLKAFEEIIEVVREKINNILNDDRYIVKRAKLYEMICMDQKQNYMVKPVWYFETLKNNTEKEIILVDAETGKEIFLR